MHTPLNIWKKLITFIFRYVWYNQHIPCSTVDLSTDVVRSSSVVRVEIVDSMASSVICTFIVASINEVASNVVCGLMVVFFNVVALFVAVVCFVEVILDGMVTSSVICAFLVVSIAVPASFLLVCLLFCGFVGVTTEIKMWAVRTR